MALVKETKLSFDYYQHTLYVWIWKKKSRALLLIKSALRARRRAVSSVHNADAEVVVSFLLQQYRELPPLREMCE